MPHHAVRNERELDQVILKLMTLGAPKAQWTVTTVSQTVGHVHMILAAPILPMQAFLWLVVMTYFHSGMPDVPEPFRCVELFAGTGNVGRSTRYGMVATAQLDKEYDNQQKEKAVRKMSAFDLTSAAGLPSLECKL